MVFLGFVTGFFGMGLAYPPWDLNWQEQNPYFALVVIILIAVVISASYYVMKWALNRRRFKVHEA